MRLSGTHFTRFLDRSLSFSLTEYFSDLCDFSHEYHKGALTFTIPIWDAKRLHFEHLQFEKLDEYCLSKLKLSSYPITLQLLQHLKSGNDLFYDWRISIYSNSFSRVGFSLYRSMYNPEEMSADPLYLDGLLENELADTCSLEDAVRFKSAYYYYIKWKINNIPSLNGRITCYETFEPAASGFFEMKSVITAARQSNGLRVGTLSNESCMEIWELDELLIEKLGAKRLEQIVQSVGLKLNDWII
jgi:hypothetical protein